MQRVAILFLIQLLGFAGASRSVTIIGSGAAALSAAIESARGGANVLIIEKTKNAGGNSAKASSGINGAETMVQSSLDIEDNVGTFQEDTVRAGQHIGNPELVEKLAAESKEAIRFLVEDMELPLTDVIQLGGHSNPRTHRLSTHAPIGFRFHPIFFPNISELCLMRSLSVCMLIILMYN
jgi:succinate dehydrogenase/fumarate reductase flavoprotein subunit